jgi:hypothetical protein
MDILRPPPPPPTMSKSLYPTEPIMRYEMCNYDALTNSLCVQNMLLQNLCSVLVQLNILLQKMCSVPVLV